VTILRWICNFSKNLAPIKSEEPIEIVKLYEIYTYIGQKTIVGYLAKSKVMSDYWKAYECFVLKEQHIQSKAETYTVEGYNSILRHKLARLHRKTKRYSKC
jgi:insertion element IS1 protein InsB